jgi:myo-inositol catabolism protein IolC
MTRTFALAFDHRNSLRRDFMQLTAQPTAGQHATMVAAKGIVTDALIAAAPRVTPDSPVLLIDHEYGGRFVAEAQAAGIEVAMPVEESGQAELRYLCDGHPERIIDAHHPDYVKVLIRYNPGGDAAMNARQRGRLRELSDSLEGRPQRLMLELLVPPEPAQLAAAGHDHSRFDRETRAALTVQAIDQIAGDGLRPALWKIEGPESLQDAARIAEAVRYANPGAGCLVLGRGADDAAVRRWLAIAAAADGFTGFAVGRTIWWDALRAFASGGGRDAAVRAVTARYENLVHYYRASAAAT